jgi:hypothetical protein
MARAALPQQSQSWVTSAASASGGSFHRLQGDQSLPESRQKYLYERLGDHDFQQLIAALLTQQFPSFVPMALRQADGGRDGLRTMEPGKVIVYQVKWSADGTNKDPVAWLDGVVRGEYDNLRRLAKQGVGRYMLVTNVASTAKPGAGTFDRLNAKLDEHAEALGYEEMTCIWREALNPWVDNAPDATKWAYADMLAGWDMVRYLVAEQAGAAKDSGLHHLVRKVAATQWGADERVKFSQSDVDREHVADLFVDVTADRIRTITPPGHDKPPVVDVGGAAKYLLGSDIPFTLIRGAPGQGKSTLGQYLCQVHRSAFLPQDLRRPSTTLFSPANPRFPLRCDLSEYAHWLSGVDIWDPSEDSKRTRITKRSGDQASIECFLADLMSHDSGGVKVAATDVGDLFARVPSLIVLDGLDEVGSPSVRARVVKAIDQFSIRGRTYETPPKVLVTTRPSADELPEPSAAMFEVLALSPLTPEQRDDYLRKWCAVRGIRGKDGRALRSSFKDKSREPYIDELAGNPMQLTILLDLLHRQGAATPTQRTDLYDQYVELLLAREANKHPDTVRKYREELLEIMPFLGWYLHAHTEESQINGRMTVGELKEAMRHFQRTYGNPESIVDELFTGASDRLWALTSKIDETYEFEVVSLREYFAARFLYRNAGEGNHTFDSTEVLRELLRRPYWLNTARFYGGNAKGQAIYTLTAGIENELRDQSSGAAVTAAWTLLTDGVFVRRPREARKVLTVLCADTNASLLLQALDRRDVVALPELPHTPETDGPDPTWSRLTNHIISDPANPQNTERVRVLRELLNQSGRFAAWWVEQLQHFAGTTRQRDWLSLAAACEGAAGLALDTAGFDLGHGNAERLLSTGVVPAPGSDLEGQLVDAVLNGECPNVTSTRSFPAQLAVALAPSTFITTSLSAFLKPDDRTARRHTDAINQLRKAGSPYAAVARQRAFRRGQKGSTFPWANTATALFEHAGRCWLTSEIAIIGAASPHRLGYVKKPEFTAFGPTGHPCELLARTRINAADATWWREQLNTLDDDLGQAEWALALCSVATGQVVAELRTDWESVIAGLPETRRQTVLRASRQIVQHSHPGRRGTTAHRTNAEPTGILALDIPATEDDPLTGRDEPPPAPSASSSLLSVARSGRWLKVDTQPTYR